METEYMLTTVDNPYDCFTDFTRWFLFDVEKGYNCCSKLARIANLTDDMTEQECNAEIEKAIDQIVLYDFMDIYKKVKRA